MLMVAIYVMARGREPAGRSLEGLWRDRRGGKEAGWGLFLIIIIIGGIYGGVFTPTEAAAVAAVYSFFIAAVRLSRHGADEGHDAGSTDTDAATRRASAFRRWSMRSPSSSSG